MICIGPAGQSDHFSKPVIFLEYLVNRAIVYLLNIRSYYSSSSSSSFSFAPMSLEQKIRIIGTISINQIEAWRSAEILELVTLDVLSRGMTVSASYF